MGSDDAGDEAISVEQLRALHGRFDENGNGQVSMPEILAFAHGIATEIATKDIAAILEEVDTSKDGKLSLEEHLNDLHNQMDGGEEDDATHIEKATIFETQKFHAADANADLVLDETEIAHLFYPETHSGVLNVHAAHALTTKDLNHDGKLSSAEFWEADRAEPREGQLSDEELDDFEKLDADKSGFLDLSEIAAWESGRFHTESAMKKLFDIADKNSDMHLSVDELTEAGEEIAASDAHYHLLEWADHSEL